MADSMFAEGANLSKTSVSPADAKALLENTAEVAYSVNPSHVPTLDAAKARFELDVVVPAKAPLVSLKSGDSLLIMSVRGLGRLEGRHEYTVEEIEAASFVFSLWSVD